MTMCPFKIACVCVVRESGRRTRTTLLYQVSTALSAGRASTSKTVQVDLFSTAQNVRVKPPNLLAGIFLQLNSTQSALLFDVLAIIVLLVISQLGSIELGNLSTECRNFSTNSTVKYRSLKVIVIFECPF
jgi:hypothetical protein